MFSFLDLLFPPKCLGCNREGSFVCTECLHQIKPFKLQKCPICKVTINQGEVCVKCQHKTALDGVVVVSSYEKNPLLRKMVSRFKYQFNRDLGEILGKLILKNKIISCHSHEGGNPVIPKQQTSLLNPSNSIYFQNNLTTILVPVPLHFLRRWKRGFNQAEILAGLIHTTTGLPLFNLLKRVRNTPQQARLKRQKRIQNLKNAFSINQKELKKFSISSANPEKSEDLSLTNVKIILVDDIASTLTTLEECARVLRKAGFKNVWGCVLARG